MEKEDKLERIALYDIIEDFCVSDNDDNNLMIVARGCV